MTILMAVLLPATALIAQNPVSSPVVSDVEDPPAAPAGFVVSDMIGDNPVAEGELFLAVGPNNVAEENIEYRLFYSVSADQPADPLNATEYSFGTTPGDGDGVNAFGFVIDGLNPGTEYTFWLYQHNSVEDVYSEPAVESAVSGEAGDDPDEPVDPNQIVEPDDENDLQKFPLAYNIDTDLVDWDDYTYHPFEGAELKRIENPDKSAGNDSDYVLEYYKNPAGQPWGGFFYHLEDTINTTDDAVFRLNVWSSRDNIQGLMKLESRDGETTGDLFADITVSGEWATVEWDLSGVDHDVNWDKVVVIMDLDTDNPPQGGGADTWYLDDFELSGVEVVDEPDEPSGPVVIESPEDKADMQEFPLVYNIDDVDVDWQDYTYFPFEGGGLRRIENPDKSAGNESDYVMEYTKASEEDGGQPWGGFEYHLEEAVNSTNETVFRLNVWSPRDGFQARMKLETRDNQNSTGDQLLDVTLAEEWNTLEWDLSGTNQDVPWDRVVIIMDLDTDNPPQGGANDTWYLDDFELAGVVSAGDPSDPDDPDDPGEPDLDLTRIQLPVDFEDQSIDWTNVFLGFEGAHVDVIENPHKDGDNDSDWVGRMVKNASIYWAGAFFWTEETFWFDEENNTITMDVWSPRSNVGINLKLEQSDGDGEFDSFAVTSTDGEWETMTWDYSGASPLIDWDQLTMIFDFHEGQNGDGGPDWTWYFDNIEVNHADPDGDRPTGPATPDDLQPVSLPLDFEDDEFDWNFAFYGFEGGHASRVENPDQSGLNTSEWVGEMVKGSGPFWAGAFMHVDQSFTIDPDNPHIAMKVWSPRAGVPVLMKVEEQDGDAEFEITSNTATSEGWEYMQWDMSGAGTEQEWDVVVMIFDFQEGGEGDASESSTWYFDDLDVNVDVSGLPTSADDNARDVPAAFELRQNYPNPFNPTTNIQFALPEQSDVSLEVFNVMGQRVAVLAGGVYQAGQHTVAFDASELASGIYIYRLQAGSFTQTQKMMLVK